MRDLSGVHTGPEAERRLVADNQRLAALGDREIRDSEFLRYRRRRFTPKRVQLVRAVMRFHSSIVGARAAVPGAFPCRVEEKFFDVLESSFPALFWPAGRVDQEDGQYIYRDYPRTKLCGLPKGRPRCNVL